MNDDWVFDQAKKVAALTSRQVMKGRLPILQVSHYSDDHSWLFGCGTTSEMKDYLLVSMEQVVSSDGTLHEIADLPPGWAAHRSHVGGEWVRYEEPDT